MSSASDASNGADPLHHPSDGPPPPLGEGGYASGAVRILPCRAAAGEGNRAKRGGGGEDCAYDRVCPCPLGRRRREALDMTSQPDNRSQFVERMLSELLTWVERERAARGLALVGSYARGAARQDSDVDLVVLVENPAPFLEGSWLDETDWRRVGASPVETRFVQYGVVWSNHVQLENGLEVEFGFVPLSWAGARPLDLGTRRVISEGCRILYDPDSLLGTACAEMSNASSRPS